MTIDSSWIASFKEESPEAFTRHIPFQPIAAFCDGQIRLMRGHNQDFMTWDTYIWQQFHAHVKRFFETHKVTTVILAFDDYANVPEAKCMTQLKRRRHLPQLEILEREPLPSFCPYGERWTQCIANRTFKAKVINLVIERLPGLLQLRPGQALIIDYAGCPKEYTTDESGALKVREIPELIPMGEADVKFTRYADLFKDLLVDSVDGDSIPIALLHHEACIRNLTEGTMDVKDLAEAPPRICIYRITTRVESDAKPEPDPSPHAKSSKSSESTKPSKSSNPNPTQTTPGESGAKKRGADGSEKRQGRTFEFVNIPCLYHALQEALAQCMARSRSPSHKQHHMSMLLALIGLTGTDYTRSLPQVSGRSLFALLPNLWMPLMASYDPAMGQLHVESATDCLAGSIYAHKYASHVHDPHAPLPIVLHALHRSKLSQRTRDSLPSASQIACTIRNVNWLIRYWREPSCTPSPLEKEEGVAKFGFVKRKGVVGYAE